MGPETKNRAPGAEKFKLTDLWRPLIVMVLAVSAVYTENQDTSNQDQTTRTAQVLPSHDIQLNKPDLIVRSISISQLKQEPFEVDLRRLRSRATHAPILPKDENPPVQALSVETQSNANEVEVIGWLISGGWPQELHSQALNVIECESTYNPNAVSPNGLYKGLFALSRGWFIYAGEDPEKWEDPVVNAKVAYKTYLYDVQVGNPPWYQWGCKPNF